MHDLFPRTKRRHIGDLNIVPILDMFVCVIFFLLLGTSFTQFTKLTLPPSAVSTVADPVVTPPLTPRLIGLPKGDQLHLVLSWEGPKPGEVEENLELGGTEKAENEKIQKTVAKMVDDFMKLYPSEKVLKVGLGSDVAYQKLVSIMDGAREKMPDLVLFSYTEAEGRTKQ